jgi:uncharacterized protein with FMN-binding domain
MWRKIVIGIAALVVCAVILFSLQVSRFEKKMDATTVVPVDISRIADGDYTGEYNLRIVSARVRAAVRNGRLKEVEVLDHRHGPGYGAEAVADSIVAAQSLTVNAVSGATGSSTVIRKAVELALINEVGTRKIPDMESADTSAGD